jgi:hypothetical protein
MNSWMMRIWPTAVVLMVVGCARDEAEKSAPSSDGAQPERVSIVQLLVTPQAFEGRHVRLQGFCHLKVEERTVYLSRDDARHVNTASAIWLVLDTSPPEFDETFVIVEGVFTSRVRGHQDLWPASIEVTRLVRAFEHRDEVSTSEKASRPGSRRNVE